MAAGCPGPGSALHLVLRATAFAVEVVIPMVDVVRAVLDVDFRAGTSTDAPDSHLPSKEVFVTATNPDQELVDFALRCIGRHLE